MTNAYERDIERAAQKSEAAKEKAGADAKLRAERSRARQDLRRSRRKPRLRVLERGEAQALVVPPPFEVTWTSYGTMLLAIAATVAAFTEKGAPVGPGMMAACLWFVFFVRVEQTRRFIFLRDARYLVKGWGGRLLGHGAAATTTVKVEHESSGLASLSWWTGEKTFFAERLGDADIEVLKTFCARWKVAVNFVNPPQSRTNR